MADAVARQRYAGDVKPVELKQRIQEAPVAHPKCVEAMSEVGEATERRDNDHGDHGGAKIVGEGEPATALTDDISSMARPTATAKAPKHYPRLGASF